MRISIFGSGYVGLVTGACMAEMGNDVVCVDVDVQRLAMLRAGEVPIYEPGLEPLLRSNMAAGRLRFTSDAAAAIDHAAVIFIAVGTPPVEDGSADLRHVLEVAASIGARLDEYAVVVNKSTVPVGTASLVRQRIDQELARRGVEVEFDVVSNPEFLKEGDAVADCMRPDRIIIGSSSPRAIEILAALYAPFQRKHERMVVMDARSAELTKYAANAMLATRISFMNEMANIAEQTGADIEMVRLGIGSDPRIGHHFIFPGVGYGGSCFPKDVKALLRLAAEHGHAASLLEAVEAVNTDQKQRLLKLIRQHFGGELSGRTVGLWGLAFKPNTDDMREAPSRVLIEGLWQLGARVRAFDPEAGAQCANLYPGRDDLVLCEDAYAVLDGADALVLVTEWKAFRSPDFDRVAAAMPTPVLFDGRNQYDPDVVEQAGIAYYGIGRGRSVRREDGSSA